MTKQKVSNKIISKQRLGRYAGEWVAFVQERVVLHSKSLQGLMKKVEAKGFKNKASVFLVPRKGEGPYVLIIGL